MTVESFTTSSRRGIDNMEVQIVDEWNKKGFHYVKITVPGAANKPILKFPLTKQTTGEVEKKQRITRILEKGTGLSVPCPIFPNWKTRSDGTCGRAGICVAHKKRCPAR